MSLVRFLGLFSSSSLADFFAVGEKKSKKTPFSFKKNFSIFCSISFISGLLKKYDFLSEIKKYHLKISVASRDRTRLNNSVQKLSLGLKLKPSTGILKIL